MDREPDATSSAGSALESTSVLLQRARDGDRAAREAISARFLPLLRSWAHGRIPRRLRSLADTDDFVQDTLLAALDRLAEFDARRPGALFAYLRQALRNRIVDQLRAAGRRPSSEELPSDIEDPSSSPLEELAGREALERYEAAFARLPEEQATLIVLRVELGLDFPEIAELIASPSPNAARMRVARALVRLAEEMDALG